MRSSLKSFSTGFKSLVLLGISTIMLVGCNASPGNTDVGTMVTVDHVYGKSEFSAPAQRVVALSPGYTDALVELGVQPVGITGFAGLASPIFPWEEGKITLAPEGPTTALQMINPTALPFEQIAALSPDAILASSMAATDESYQRLQEIAPTVAAFKGGRELDTWQDQTAVAGQVIGKENEAKELTQRVEATARDVAERFPKYVGASMAMVFYAGSENIQIVSDPRDVTAQTLELMSFTIPKGITGLRGGEGARQGRLSMENLDLLSDADFIVIGSMGDLSELESSSIWKSLPAVQNDRVVVLDAAGVTAFRVPTVLAIPYIIEQLEPYLER